MAGRGRQLGRERYLEIRRRLVSYFDRRGRPAADELADETLTRIARTLAQVGEIAVRPPARYCYVVAKFVLLEDVRRERRYVALDESRSAGVAPGGVEADEGWALRERRLDCLDQCLQQLKPAQRELIVEYYADDRRQKIERRRELAKSLGITMNALGIRALRIRDGLMACMGRCHQGRERFSARGPIGLKRHGLQWRKGGVTERRGGGGSTCLSPNEPPSSDVAFCMNDQVLVRYLLGLLSPEDADRLDEASLVDDAIAARLRIVEDDLVDGYVRGTLAGETLARFESHYLSSPRRRERVAFARRFVPVVDRAVAPPVAPPRRSALSVLFRPSILAIAAALLLVASGTLLFQTVRLTRGLSVAQRERVILDRRARELEQQVADLRAGNTGGPREPARMVQPATTAVQEAPAIALMLLPQTRSIASIPTLSIPAGAGSVGLELRLESIEFPRYQVGLKDPAANTIVWRSDWIAAISSAGEPSLRIALPADVLKPQHYSLDLSGQRPGGGPEVIGSYAFEIMPR